jgi:hypothetical protein
MSNENENKALVVTRFTGLWNENDNLGVVGEPVPPDRLLQYSLPATRLDRGGDAGLDDRSSPASTTVSLIGKTRPGLSLRRRFNRV